MDIDETQQPRQSRTIVRVSIVLALIILPPCLFGFIAKFSEFVATFRQDELGVFAIQPIFNYLLATCGFCLLLVWAIMHGMFHDVEAPKYQFLEQEYMLDHPPDDEDDDSDGDGGPDEPVIPEPDYETATPVLSR